MIEQLQTSLVVDFGIKPKSGQINRALPLRWRLAAVAALKFAERFSA